jgi:predicted MFS family arabinose efflux permease
VALVAPLWSFEWVLVGTFWRAVGGGVVWVFSTQLLLHRLPAGVRGRVFATELALFTLANAIGAAAAGWALDRTGIGLDGLAAWIAGLTLVPGLLWLAATRRRLRSAGPPAESVRR